MTGREQRVHGDGEMSMAAETAHGGDHEYDEDGTPTPSGGFPVPVPPAQRLRPQQTQQAQAPQHPWAHGAPAPRYYGPPTGPNPYAGPHRYAGPAPVPPQAHWVEPHRSQGHWVEPHYSQPHHPQYDQSHYDVDETPREGNGAAVTSCVLAVLGLLLSLRPLVFGSNAMAADTYVALLISVVALVLGVVGARLPRRRPATVVGIALSLLALLLIAVIPTL